jgi:diadenylate cyclase
VNLLDQLRMLSFGWRDAVEITIIAYVLYRLLRLLRGTRTVQLLTGLVVLMLAWAVALVLKLTTITYLLGLVFTYGALAALIVLQPELRSALAQLGHSPVTRFFRRIETSEVADEIAEAVELLSLSRVGCIIAIERERPLTDFIRSGSPMEAKVTSDLLRAIFTPYSPLHDGAVLIRGDMIIGAGCILPLTQQVVDDRSMGTRHLAALGLAEETDALVIAVSEETGTISVAEGGRLARLSDTAQLRDRIAGRTPAEVPARPLAEVPG